MIFASNNKGKLEEIRKIFNEYEIYSLKDKKIDIDVEEDQDTFLGNAKKKAKIEFASEEFNPDVVEKKLSEQMGNLKQNLQAPAQPAKK